MPTDTQEAVISNEALVAELESKLDSVSLEAKIVLKDAIKRIKNIGKYSSKFFKRDSVITIEQVSEFAINKANIRKSLEKVITREKDRGSLQVFIDRNIWIWDLCEGKTMTAIENQFNATIHRFTQKVTHEQVYKEADKLSAQKDWSISEVWNIIIAGILAGEVDTNGTGIFAYFTVKVKDQDILFRFRAFRGGDGRLSVGVCKSNWRYEWGPGCGIVLSN